VSFATITLCIPSQRVFIVVVYFVIDSVRKLLDTTLCVPKKKLVGGGGPSEPLLSLRDLEVPPVFSACILELSSQVVRTSSTPSSSSS
jgi:hypothetical protein